MEGVAGAQWKQCSGAPVQSGEKKRRKMSFLEKQGEQIVHPSMGNRWHGWDADARGLLENAGGNQSDATATGGVWSFRCLCLGEAHPHAPPQTPPHPGSSQALLPCAQCPLRSDRSSHFLKIWKAKGGKSSAYCAQRCSRCIPSSAADQTCVPSPCHQPPALGRCRPWRSWVFSQALGAPGCPKSVPE